MDGEIDTKTFIEEQLMSNGIFYVPRENDFAMYCPFWAHEGNTLLMQVCFDGLKIHCWGCGHGGNYNTLAAQMNLKKLPDEAFNGYAALDRQLKNVLIEPGLPSLPKGITKFEEDYRGLSASFMSQFDSRKWFDVDSGGWRVLWPITYNYKLQGWTAGRLHPDMEPKYRHGPKGVIQTRRCLFPIDYKGIRETVVLVEGPFSALRLISEGIPALAVLGAGNWHRSKVRMLQQRKVPVKGVIIAFDPDKSGEKGADTVEESISGIFERVERFDCPVKPLKVPDPNDSSKMVCVYERDKKTNEILQDPETGKPIKVMTKMDPGDMPRDHVERLRRMFVDVQTSVKSKRQEQYVDD